MTILYITGPSAVGIPAALTKLHSQRRFQRLVIADDPAGESALEIVPDLRPRVPYTYVPTWETQPDPALTRDAVVYAAHDVTDVLLGGADEPARLRAIAAGAVVRVCG